MRTIFVYRCHVWDDFTREQLRRLQADCGQEDVFVLYDDTKNRFPDGQDASAIRPVRCSEPRRPDANVILVNYRECCQINLFHRDNKEQVESQVLRFREGCPVAFDYMWLLEHDVVCDGSWKTTLGRCEDRTEDFLATCVEEFEENRFWGLWYKLYGTIPRKPRLATRAKSFFPVVRLSAGMLDTLRKNLNRYSGMCEVYFPTLAKHSGLTYGNLPSEMLGSVFVYSVEKDFRVGFEGKDQLYHPIISFEQVVSSAAGEAADRPR
ncbi:hypothetical protein EBZ80_18770 [bacterium]|nr:hypothetical protein [bacterium]